jgi:hypothetical protein
VGELSRKQDLPEVFDSPVREPNRPAAVGHPRTGSGASSWTGGHWTSATGLGLTGTVEHDLDLARGFLDADQPGDPLAIVRLS